MSHFNGAPRFPALRKLIRGYSWLKVPPALASHKVCLLGCYTGNGRLSRHTLHLATQWKAQGFTVLLIVATDRNILNLDEAPGLSAVDGLMLRTNRGYDFGSWVQALQSRPDIRDATLLAMTNDSVYGPLHGFAELLARVEAIDGDVIGMTDSYEVQYHIQSYLVFYRPTALKSQTFERFWAKRPAGGRVAVILKSEVPLLSELRQGGLRVATLFPVPTTTPLNPTVLRWRELLDAGFPFVKIQVLRDSFRGEPIDGWERILADRGFDPALVREHLGV